MADFVAVLRKTIDALGENTPAMREKVFDKARAAIEAKLAAIQPPPPPAVMERQRKALEDAIVVVRAEYQQPAPQSQVEDDLEEIFASLAAPSTRPAAAATLGPAPVRAEAQTHAEPSASSPEPARFEPQETHVPSEAELAAEPDDEHLEGAYREPLAPQPAPRPPRRRGAGRRIVPLIAAAVVLVIVAGGGYALWLNRADLAAIVGYGSLQQAVEAQTDPDQAAAEASDPATDEPEEAADAPAPVEETPVEQAAAAPAAESSEPAERGPATAAPEKFTQRLLADGTEVDPGPAGGERRIGEGTSMASAAQPAAGTQNGQTAQPQQNTQVAVGQRAIFYEERTGTTDGSAEVGSIVWSVVRESPGGDEPPEPAIRAEATIPAHNLQLRMTIRRNADQTLPASHIIEMIFLTPENFAGGAIDNVLRIAMKDTEQAAGVPLMGIPAKIADGFFLIALSDSPAETTANLNVMSRQSWIDVPVIYRSGRRALMTMEKGLPGERVFNEAIQAWREASSSG